MNIRRWLSWNLLKLSNWVDPHDDFYQLDSEIVSMVQYGKKIAVFTKRHVYLFDGKKFTRVVSKKV